MAEKRDLVAKSRLIDELSLKNRLIEYFTQWEVLLSIIIVLVFVFFTIRTPYFLDWFNLMNATFQFSEKAIMALPMIFIIMCGDIDISIASIIALCAYAVGNAAQGGASIPSLIFIALLVGTLAGLFNGVMITALEMPAIAVTLATQSVFRGIAIGLLGDQARTEFPENFGFFGQQFIPGTIIPFEFVLYLVLVLVFAFVLHKTTYGRRLYAIGNSAEAARFRYQGKDHEDNQLHRYRILLWSYLYTVGQSNSLCTLKHCHRMGFGNHHPRCAWWCCHHRGQGKCVWCFHWLHVGRLLEVRYGLVEVQWNPDDHCHWIASHLCGSSSPIA